jgi:hypothetical protein
MLPRVIVAVHARGHLGRHDPRPPMGALPGSFGEGRARDGHDPASGPRFLWEGVAVRPLVPEDVSRYAASAREAHVATLVRAAIAIGRNAVDRQTSAADYARKQWPDDRNVGAVLRAAVSPMSLANADGLAQVTHAFLATLVPVSAGADLLQRGLGLSFDGAAQVTVPSISVPLADFVGEGVAIPVQTAQTGSGTTLSPHKLAVVATLTNEMMLSPNAEPMVRQVLVESTGPAIDRVLFSANAAAADRPAGILNGIAPLMPAGPGEKNQAIVDDLQALATAVAPVSGNNQIALIGAPAQAVAIALRSPREITWPLMMSGSLAAGTVIAVAVNTLVAAIEGSPLIDASREVLVHEETAPAAIVDGAGVVAKPVRSVYQTDSAALRMRWPISWALRDARGVAWMQSVQW